MKKVVRYTLCTVFFCLTAIYLTTFLNVSAKKREQTNCSGLKVVITDSSRNHFVSRGDIKAYLDKDAGQYIGKPVNELDLTKIEEIIDSKSAIYKSQAFITSDGVLNIEITQRKPMIRFQKHDGGFYADEQGYLFPLQHNFTAHVPVIDGYIPLKANSGYKGEVEDKTEKEWLDRILALVRYIQKNSTLKRNIVQISVLKNGDLVIVPRTGKEKFIFGQPTDIEKKFKMMENYYTAITPEKGEDFYSTVNLKYEGQIICRK